MSCLRSWESRSEAEQIEILQKLIKSFKSAHTKPKPHSQVGEAALASDKSSVRTEDKLRKGKHSA